MADGTILPSPGFTIFEPDAVATLRTLDSADLLSTEFPPRELVLTPWLPAKGLAMVYGERGIGKTYLSLGIAYAVAIGGHFLRWHALKARKVLVIDGEMPGAALKERMKAMLMETGAELPHRDFLRFLPMDLQASGNFDLADKHCQASLEIAAGDADLLIVDNISTLVSGGRENEAESWLPVQQWALAQRRTGRTVVFIHHAGKGGKQRGTSRREDVLDTVMALRRPDDYQAAEGARFEIHFEKSRGFYGIEAQPFEATLTPNAGWTTRDLVDSEMVAVMVATGEGMSIRDIGETLGLSRSKVQRLQIRGKQPVAVPPGHVD